MNCRAIAAKRKYEDSHFHHDLVYATVLKEGIEMNTVNDESVDNKEWTPLQEWRLLSERNRRMLDILEDPRYGVFLELPSQYAE